MKESSDPRGESADERIDRNLTELLGELRVAVPGVQVLFAFLLVVPFNTGFSELNRLQEIVFLAALLLTAAATILLVAPTARHRWTFRLQDKERLLRRANFEALMGLAALAAAMTAAISLVTSVVFDDTASAVLVAIAVGGMFAYLWFASPFIRRRRLLRERDGAR